MTLSTTGKTRERRCRFQEGMERGRSSEKTRHPPRNYSDEKAHVHAERFEEDANSLVSRGEKEK